MGAVRLTACARIGRDRKAAGAVLGNEYGCRDGRNFMGTLHASLPDFCAQQPTTMPSITGVGLYVTQTVLHFRARLPLGNFGRRRRRSGGCQEPAGYHAKQFDVERHIGDYAAERTFQRLTGLPVA